MNFGISVSHDSVRLKLQRITTSRPAGRRRFIAIHRFRWAGQIKIFRSHVERLMYIAKVTSKQYYPTVILRSFVAFSLPERTFMQYVMM